MADLILETAADAQAKVDTHDSSGTAHPDIRALITTTPDATSSVKGKVQLAGDLGGTAASPTVPGLTGKAAAVHTHAESDVTSLVSDLAGKQPLDSDLTAIAALSPADGSLMQRVSGAWSSITIAALKTALSLVKGDVGLGNVDNTSNATERAATRTLTNARITKRVGTTASSATPTADADNNDFYTVTAAAVGMTVGAPTGTPTDVQPLVFRFKDNGTARSLAWNAIFRAVGVTLPTTTVISKTLYVGCWYNAADTKWDVTAVGQE
jgi:hypothetical protein